MHTRLQSLAYAMNKSILEESGLPGIIVISIALVLMLFICFTGYFMKKKLIIAVNSLIGFLLGFMIFAMPIAWVVNYFFDSPTLDGIADIIFMIILLLLCLAAAIGMGIASHKLPRFGRFICIGTLIQGIIYDFLGQFMYVHTQYAAWISIAVGTLAGILALKFPRPVTILATAISGGFASSMYASVLISMLFHNTYVAFSYMSGRTTEKVIWPVILIGAVIAVFGAMIQFYITKRQTIQK